jgi:hypothetical protein
LGRINVEAAMGPLRAAMALPKGNRQHVIGRTHAETGANAAIVAADNALDEQARSAAVALSDQEFQAAVTEIWNWFNLIPRKPVWKAQAKLIPTVDQPYESDFFEFQLTQKEPYQSSEEYELEYDATTLINFSRTWNQLAVTGRLGSSDSSLTAKFALFTEKGARECKRQECLNAYENQLIRWRIEDAKELKAFEVKKAAIIKTFNQIIGPLAMCTIKDLFEKSEYRRCWLTLCKRYSSESGGSETRAVIVRLLSSFVWRGNDINAHIAELEEICGQAIESGYTVNEEMRLQYLIDSIRSCPSAHNGFNNKILECVNLQVEMDKKYGEIKMAIQRKVSQESVNQHLNAAVASQSQARVNGAQQAQKPKDKKGGKKPKGQDPPRSSASSASSAAPARGCSFCHDPRHNEATCFKKHPCPKCGQKGHGGWMCDAIKKKDAAAVIDESKPAVSSSSSLSGAFKADHKK